MFGSSVAVGSSTMLALAEPRRDTRELSIWLGVLILFAILLRFSMRLVAFVAEMPFGRNARSQARVPMIVFIAGAG